MSEQQTETEILHLDSNHQAEPGGLVLASDVLPSALALIPLRPRPTFPNLLVPMAVSEPHQVQAVKRALETPSRALGLVLARDQEQPDGPENMFSVGVAGKIVKVLHSDDNGAQFLVSTLERFTIQEIKLFLGRSSLDDPGRLADFAANLTSAEGAELQQVLESFDVRRRIDMVLVLLKKELEVSRLQTKITKQIEEKISSQQREFFLREQLKAIKKELGLEKEGKTSEIEKFEERLKGLKLNDEAQRAVTDELEKFRLLDPSSPEYHVSRNYLDWLTILPWGKNSRDSYNLDKARRILDRDHHGLGDVKDRIIEFIAVGKMKGDISGSIICLVGPPGVGKTSIGRSIANALGRSFYRFSLGGMRDEAEIKGHRRTYIGAMPGKVIQAMKTAGKANPVLMLDEIDKVSSSYQGDPASALLEVLDPEQNGTFRDHYLDVPFDLSNVLFIATANQLDTVPAPLLDRMEVIRLSGYVLEEKMEIAKRYLIPKAMKNAGLKSGQVSIRKDALAALIDGWAREAGVRTLENRIKQLMRKASLQFATGRTAPVVITSADLPGYLGQPVFTTEEVFEQVPGVVTGLAWTSMGGATLPIEATAMPSKNKGFRQTGQLGNVMIESSEIAYSYVMAHLGEYGASEDYFDTHFVHLHVPAGATPKDGPSAGVTMATALISMMSGVPVRPKLGMTGELTLTGRVLPIGGVKEKTIAARRAGLKVLIFPDVNKKDFDELPEYLKEGLEVHFAREYKEVYKVAFQAQ